MMNTWKRGEKLTKDDEYSDVRSMAEPIRGRGVAARQFISPILFCVLLPTPPKNSSELPLILQPHLCGRMEGKQEQGGRDGSVSLNRRSAQLGRQFRRNPGA